MRAGAILLAGLLGAVPAAAQNGAVATLLAQGNHWLAQNRPDLAIAAFDRVLTVDPANVEALAAAAQAQAERGNAQAADALLARLRQVTGSGDPRVAAAETRLRGATVDRAELADARRLAAAGRGAEAVARYREAFGSATAPDALAIEFNLVLAGTEAGWAEARAALARRVAARPQDVRGRLALAEVLTYREPTRAEGIAALQALASDPVVGQAAGAAWRQAVVWIGVGPQAVPALEAFSARFPADTGIAQRLAQARAAPTGVPAAGDVARLRGFAALEANRAPEAERDFEAALAANPRDADALGGLGVLRLRQGRPADARALLERAVAAAPDRGTQWQQALEGASYGAELAEARRQMAAGRPDLAEPLLQRAVQRPVPDRADAETMLGEALLRRGDALAAEARFRAALAGRPNFAAANAGLERALRQQGRRAEADEIARRLRLAGPGPGAGSGLRAEAARAASAEDSAALLRSALAAEPSNPWIRLDLARILLRQGRGPEGRALVDETAGASADGTFAAALFAEEEGRLADAAALLGAVPAGRRSAEMNRLLARTRTAEEIAAAADAARGAMGFEGRNRLFAIAARQDASGATGAAVVRAFATAQDGAAADEAARIATTANRQMTAAGRLAIAGALLEAGRADAAQAMLASAEAGGRLGPEERRQADALRTGIAVRASDQLNEQGDQAAGFERLRPALARTPADPSANLALARLHQGARQPQEALRIAEAVLLRDPRNMEARAAVMDAAIAARDIRRAEAMLAEARAAAPQDPRVLLLEARLARAVGDSRRAERALLEAAERRRAQTGADRASLAYAAGRAPGAAATIANPFRQAAGQPAGAAASDPLGAEIARELAALREESATRFALTPGLRTRSGSAGLDRLDEISARAEASIAAGMAGGRVTFGATPVMLSAGDLDNDVQARRRFGTNALAGPSGGRAPTDTTASGMGLDIGWRRGAFAVDVGTTPLGFETTNIVGGVEFAPALTDRMRLRVTGERRAMTDSLLSYGGQRDPLTGRSWGGVVRTGGRAQIEFSAGPATFYAGGGFAQLDGQGVADNNRIEAGAGMSYTVYRRLDEELTAGLDLVYFAYDRNLRYFTLGHGGYFSPQSYAALNVPVDWRARSGDLSWRLGATVGFASWQEDEAPLFPGDAGLQGRLVAAAASDPTLRTTYAGQTEAGFTGGLRADLEYQLSTQLRVGAGLRYDQAADWNETRGFAYLRYLLGD